MQYGELLEINWTYSMLYHSETVSLVRIMKWPHEVLACWRNSAMMGCHPPWWIYTLSKQTLFVVFILYSVWTTWIRELGTVSRNGSTYYLAQRLTRTNLFLKARILNSLGLEDFQRENAFNTGHRKKSHDISSSVYPVSLVHHSFKE